MPIQTTMTRQEVTKIFRDVPRYIDGSLRHDKYSIRRVFWSTLGHEIFSRLYDSYRIRSEGGTDDLGNVFKPLARSTIANRKIGRGNLGSLKFTKKQSGTSFKDRQRGLLTPTENRKWKAIYFNVFNELLVTMDWNEAKATAAKIAWGVLKKNGARTKIQDLGDRNVLIMRDTDTLYESFHPGDKGARTYRPTENQIFEVDGTTATIGTSVEYASFHNETRPTIPDNIQPWVNESIDLAFNGVMDHIKNEVLQ